MTHDPSSDPSSASKTTLFDVITVLFVILTVLVLGWGVLILNDPNMTLNPFPPPTVVPIIQPPTFTPSATVTNTPLPTETPTPTHTPTVTVTPTATAPPTDTPTATATATQVLSGVTTQPPAMSITALTPIDDGSGGIVPGSETLGVSVATATRSPFPFTASPARYEANTGDQACQWLSIAGTVTDLGGRALPGLAIEINGNGFHNVQFSGSAARWGESGFEFNLGAAPRTATYTLRVVGPTGGPISEVIYVETGNTCQRNIAIVDFVQNHSY
jgi:hypothetical protein